METTQRSSMHSGIVPCLRFVYTPTFHGLRRPALGMLTAGHPITDRKTETELQQTTTPLQPNSSNFKSLVLTHTYARILDYKGCVADTRATKTDMQTKIHGWILGYRSWQTQQRRHSLRTISCRLAASRTKATQQLQPESRRTKLSASKTKATLQPLFNIRASLLE